MYANLYQDKIYGQPKHSGQKKTGYLVFGQTENDQLNEDTNCTYKGTTF